MSGRSIVAVKTVIAATPLFQVGVWLSLITFPIVNQNVVLKLKEVTVGRVIGMWTPEIIARVHENLSQFEASRREAVKKIEESSTGECSFCQEEIMKNRQQAWESSSLLEYCTKSRDHKHTPKMRRDNND